MKKTAIILLAIILICPSVKTIAQTIDFDLGSYRLPDYRRDLLDIEFDFNGQTKNTKYINNYFTDDEFKYSYLKNTITAMYSSYSNSTYFQREMNTWISLPMNYSKTNDDEKLLINPSLKSELINRQFLNDENFFETDLNLSFSANYNKSTGNDALQTLQTFVEVPLKYGSGRIEEVQDARQAVYILQELQNMQFIKKVIDNDAIVALATRISQLKTARFYDSRIQKIKELETIDQFLRENQYIDNNSIGYFSILNDMWDYGRNQIRKSGTSAALAAYPGISTITFIEDSESITTVISSLSGGFEFNIMKPITLKTQNNTSFKLLGGIMQEKNLDNENKNQYPHLQLALNQNIGYYPSTRTDFSFFINASVYKFFELIDDDPTISQPEAIGVQANGGVLWNYYITERLRLNASWNLNFAWQDNGNFAYMPVDKPLNGEIFSQYLNMYTTNTINPDEFFVEKNIYQTFNIRLVYSLF